MKIIANSSIKNIIHTTFSHTSSTYGLSFQWAQHKNKLPQKTRKIFSCHFQDSFFLLLVHQNDMEIMKPLIPTVLNSMLLRNRITTSNSFKVYFFSVGMPGRRQKSCFHAKYNFFFSVPCEWISYLDKLKSYKRILSSNNNGLKQPRSSHEIL